MELRWASGGVISADGVEVARAERSWFRERAEVQIGPATWHYRSDGGWTRSRLVGELDGVVRMRATRSGAFSSRWTVDTGSGQVELASAGWFGSRLTVARAGAGAGAVIGEGRPAGSFSTRPRLTLGEPVSTQAACFLLWVVHVELSRRQASS